MKVRSSLIGLVGAIVGAIIAVFGATHYKDWLYGPPEAIFTVGINSLTKQNVPELAQDQIHSYPSILKIAHIDGPPAKDITITVDSKSEILNQKYLQKGDNCVVKLSTDKKQLIIKIPTLRKNSIIQCQFTSSQSPELKKKTIMSSGILIENKAQQKNNNKFPIISGLLLLLLIVSISTFKIKRPQQIKENEYNIFLSTPMSSFKTQKEYQDHRLEINELTKNLEKNMQMTSYFSGKNITKQKHFEQPDIAAKGDLSALDHSKIFIMILPSKVYSSVLVEAGYALALKIPSIYFLKNENDLPFMLSKMPQSTKGRAKIYKYETISEIYQILKRDGEKIFADLSKK